MELNHFSHLHPLFLLEDKSDQVREAYCSGCRELIQDLSYRCANCKLYLHKSCAELPRELDHPFHPQHPLVLYDKPQYDSPHVAFTCSSCQKLKGEGFVYHCSTCEFDLDIQCALLPKLIIGDFLKLKHICHHHPLFFIEKHYIESEDQSCSACEDPISGPIYCCFDCQVFFHKKCAERPLMINHPSHRKHSLTLLPSPVPRSHSKHSLALLSNYPHEEDCSCHLCNKLPKGFVYYCSACEFSIPIKYTFFHLFEEKTHEHLFTLLPRPMSFICDACGICGEYCMPYICTICNVVVHKDCISLPHTIKLKRHEHSISHIYFLKENEDRKIRICRICRKEVNMEHGSYHCLDCDYFVHVNCARDKGLWDNEIFEVEDLCDDEIFEVEEVNQKSSETSETLGETLGEVNQKSTETSETLGETLGEVNQKSSETTKTLGEVNQKFSETLGETLGEVNQKFSETSETLGETLEEVNQKSSETSETLGEVNKKFSETSETLGEVYQKSSETTETLGEVNQKFSETTETLGETLGEVNQKSSETLREREIKHFSHDHKLLDISPIMAYLEFFPSSYEFITGHLTKPMKSFAQPFRPNTIRSDPSRMGFSEAGETKMQGEPEEKEDEETRV